MNQIARRLDLLPAKTPNAYLDSWRRFQTLQAARARLRVLAPRPDIRLYRDHETPDPHRVMVAPRYGWKRALWINQNGRCQYCCGSLLPRYHVDHIHPRAKGGKNHPSNYCLACPPCNHAKRDKSAMDFTLSLLGASSR